MLSGPTHTLRLEIRDGPGWRAIGAVTLLGPERDGLDAKTEFVYDVDYALEYAERRDFRAVSCLTPVSFQPFEYQGWPPFLLDLFPQGAALRYIVDHYRIADRPENYWKIIKTARLNPPGNLRAVTTNPPETPTEAGHIGFERTEVLAKGPDFLEYMVEHGAPVAGTTGAAGAAPKFLLREDATGRFHADGSLSDRLTKTCWLVKFPRGRTADDKDILRAEKAYADIAKAHGITVHAPLDWERNCLFVPRFDRQVSGQQVAFAGLESFYSLVGLPVFGSRLLHETYVSALAEVSTGPTDDVIEYVLRDFLNVMMGNTDNHGRNTSVLKGDGWVRLSPLYDFAPMKFDPEGIVRNTRWGPETDDGKVEAIAAFLQAKCGVDTAVFESRISGFFKQATKLDDVMRRAGIHERFVARTSDERTKLLDEIDRFLGRKR